jgi:CxxC motif-containing protein (DUF1111 family)
MIRTYRIWYCLALVLALVPPGTRWLFWSRSVTHTVDLAMAQAGEVLFKHDWTPKDPLCSDGDGLGPVFNATSCVACHHQGGAGGGGGLPFNVTAFSVQPPGQKLREGIVHAHHTQGAQKQETLRDVHPELPAIAQPALAQLVSLPGPGTRFQGTRGQLLTLPSGVLLSQRNTPALFGARLIDEIPDRIIVANAKAERMRWGMASHEDETVPVGRPLYLPDGRVGRFGWKAQMASLSDFVRAACANELGLSNPAQDQPTPLYAKVAMRSTKYDLTLEQCDQITAFCAALARPVEQLPKDITAEHAAAGRALFLRVGCVECHTPNLGSVEGLYSDLLLHRMGADLAGGGYYGDPLVPVSGAAPGTAPTTTEWRTPPLWGVADSAPYLHDGRAPTLDLAIRLHGGQGTRAARNYVALDETDQAKLIAFLKTLRAP